MEDIIKEMTKKLEEKDKIITMTQKEAQTKDSNLK